MFLVGHVLWKELRCDLLTFSSGLHLSCASTVRYVSSAHVYCLPQFALLFLVIANDKGEPLSRVKGGRNEERTEREQTHQAVAKQEFESVTKMASELAREIINQAHPPDQPTPFALRIPTEVHPGYNEHVTITSSVRHGRRVLTIQFPESQGSTTLVYSVEDNLEGAVFCLASFMLYGDGACRMEMKPVNLRTGGVDEQFTLATWDLTPTSTRNSTPRDGQDDVHQQVKKIVMTLCCDTGFHEAGNEVEGN